MSLAENKTPVCLFCGNTKTASTPFEDTVFNNKTFEYVRCTKCNLIYVHPLPTTEDITKMYPVEYQGALTGPAYGRYDELFEKIKAQGNFTNIVDYGCGAGRFTVEAIEKGLTVTGVEYNPALVANLAATFTKATFITVDDFYKNDKKFDIIFLSNVLEHLPNPKEIMLKLKERLNPNGLFVLEGPVENNFNLTIIPRKTIFFIRKYFFKKKASHTPTHLLYSNAANQEQFFKDIGLETIYYKINESNRPFMYHYADCKTISQKIMFFVASFSVKMSTIFSFWGNEFMYIGKIKQ